jgi:Ni,Fe-hydrogenase III small subunit/ferredoxin
MPWITRGLKDGIVTTRYPKRPDGYDRTWRGSVSVNQSRVDEPPASGDLESVASSCPTEAIRSENGLPRLDRGRCILCGRCVELYSDLFTLGPDFENSVLRRESLVVPQAAESEHALTDLRGELHRRVRALRRSIHVRHVDAGSDGSDEWEIAALTNPIYDIQRLGIFFTATPRHADVLLVTGVGTLGMADPLRRTYEAMPYPKVVIAAGAEAASGGIFARCYGVNDGVGELVPVDVWVPGSPASPFGLLHGLLLAIGLLPRRSASRPPEDEARQ